MAGGRACRAGGTGPFAACVLRRRNLSAEGHFLVYGLPSLEQAPPGILVRDLIELVRQHDAAIVAAHPFRWDQPFDQIVAEHGHAFDALELVSNNVDRYTRAKTRALLHNFPMGTTGSSDAHEIDVLGCYFTEFPRPVESISDFVAALRGAGPPGKSRRRSPLERAGRLSPPVAIAFVSDSEPRIAAIPHDSADGFTTETPPWARTPSNRPRPPAATCPRTGPDTARK